jgi:hypothetical protein
VYLNILYLFLTFKSANIFVINYLWVYYLWILILICV